VVPGGHLDITVLLLSVVLCSVDASVVVTSHVEQESVPALQVSRMTPRISSPGLTLTGELCQLVLVGGTQQFQLAILHFPGRRNSEHLKKTFKSLHYPRMINSRL
jgi:hypothetical protein